VRNGVGVKPIGTNINNAQPITLRVVPSGTVSSAVGG
jgi:hypothetical protein